MSYFINKYFKSNIHLASKLQEKIETNTESNLKTLVTNLMNTLLLCVVFEDNDGDLPTTVTELYKNLIDCIWKRYCKRNEQEEKKYSVGNGNANIGKTSIKKSC